MVRTKKKRKSKRKEELIIKKNRRKFIQKILEAGKKSQEAKCGPWTVFVLQEKFFLRENMIDQTYRLDEKVAAVLPGTVRYICGALQSKGKRRQIFQVPMNEHEQMLASL